jgi:hypothetical protein
MPALDTVAPTPASPLPPAPGPVGLSTDARAEAPLAVLALDAAAFRRHPLHETDARSWPESNCYADLWIELLHAHGLDPIPALAFTVAVDFEGDQWTFFKPPFADLEALYGLDVQELNVWGDLASHVREQVARGRIVLVEVDAFFLPDTAGTTYRTEHGKTTIAVNALDPRARRLGYFHNAGYFALEGDDYDGVFGAAAAGLPPYAELVKRHRVRHADDATLAATGRALLARHVARMPEANPLARYAERLLHHDGPWLLEQQLATFHRYAFATLRQCGAAYDLAAAHVRWLAAREGCAAATAGLESAVRHLDAIAAGARTVQLRLARVAHTKRPVDLAPTLAELAGEWEAASLHLRTVCAAWT